MLFHQYKRIFFLWTILMLLLISPFCMANVVETQLSSDQIGPGDVVTVTYVLNDNGNRRSPDFSVLQKDFRIVSTNYGNSISMVNGATSVQTFWRLQLMPKKSGELWIPAINFGNDQSTAQKLTVTASSIPQSRQNTYHVNNQNAPVFVRGEISTDTPYVQSQLIYTFKLFYRTQLKSPSIEFPNVKDITFVELNNRSGYQTTINGYVYNVVEKRFAVFPKNPGQVVLPPMKFHAYILDENLNPYDNPFSFDEPKPITIATRDFNLTVRDVPSSYPDSIWLPAKNLSLNEIWSDQSNTWEAGTPVTRTIKITAQGLRGDQLPDVTIEKLDGVNVYVDPPKRSNITQDNLIVGVLEQKVTYIPNKTQSLVIPAVKVNWWNTETNTNATSQLNETNININGIAVSAQPLPHHIAPKALAAPKTSIAISNAFYTSIWFWIACVIFSAWLITLWFIFRKKSVVPINANIQTHRIIELSEKEFEQACRTGQALEAQQFILSWAKKYWPNIQINLMTLRQMIADEQFQAALVELEQVIYGKTTKNWHGETLLLAFRNIKKSRPFTLKNELMYQSDPLPPLNPTH